MSEDNTQPVATEAEPAVPSAAEAASAQNDTSSLDALLSEFNEGTTKTKPAPQVAAPDNKADVLQQRLDAIERRLAAEQETKDFGGAIKEVKGDFQVPDYAIRGWLSSEAEADPRINKVWEQRHQNPAAAKKLLTGLKSKFAAEQAKQKTPDAEVTSDKLAVAAAVRGTSTKAPETPSPNYGAMDDKQFAAEKAKYGL